MQHPALGYRERAVADSYTPGTVHGAAHGLSGALLLRVKPEQFRQGFRLYSATFLVMLMIIACRITFVPDKLMVLLFPPILLLIVVWQLCCCIWVSGKATSIDSTLGWVSLAVYLVAFIFAFVGYTFVALLILVWWYFLLAVWLTVVCVLDLMNRYKERWLDKRVEAMRNRITYVSGEDRESLLFGATWFYDFIRQVAVPTILLLSLPMCVRLSLSMFDFDDLFVKFYENPFIQLYDNSGFWIECDGMRGKVTAINYQCVQAETIEGTEMSFLNSSLFGKNFNNLTRNNSYELTIVTVGVAYGTEIQRVREVLVEGMQKMRTKDQYGRDIVDPNYGFNVVVGNMSDSAVDINVKQMVLVAERVAYFDRAKEAIYDALTAAGITIAFPQCDVHLIQEE